MLLVPARSRELLHTPAGPPLTTHAASSLAGTRPPGTVAASAVPPYNAALIATTANAVSRLRNPPCITPPSFCIVRTPSPRPTKLSREKSTRQPKRRGLDERTRYARTGRCQRDDNARRA